MREKARDKGRLQNILECSRNAMQFAEGISYEQFVADRMRYFAIMKNVEIIGEAANMLTVDFRNQHSEIPWVFGYRQKYSTLSVLCPYCQS